MELNPDFRDLLQAFADCGVEYLIVGGYATAAHDLRRATKDPDVWIRCTIEHAECVQSTYGEVPVQVISKRHLIANKLASGARFSS